MRDPHQTRTFTPRSVAVALAGLLVAGLAAVTGPALAASHSPGMTMATKPMARVGTTAGWLHGRTVTFRYSKQFFCKQPPSSKTKSKCELGAPYTKKPSSDFDPLYVVVPIGFTPAKSTLQCPVAGRCVDHPHRIDLSRVFGKGTGHSLLPPHSHVVTTAANHKAEWWNVDVIGVTSQQAWHRIVSGKSYKTIRMMRMNHNKHITANVPTNLFLFFSVLRSS
jgi:hypothetical protein